MMPIWTISLRFFSPPEKPTLTGRLSISASMPSSAAWLARELEESRARQLRFAARAALRIEAVAQELEVGDAGDFDRILEAEEQPGGGALVRLHGEQVQPSLVIPGLTRDPPFFAPSRKAGPGSRPG